MRRFGVFIGLLLPTISSAYTRYNPEDGVLIYPEGDTTHFAQYPIQDTVYRWAADFHLAMVLPIVLLFVLQWFRKKGTKGHVKLGRVLSWGIMPIFLPAALFLQGYHVIASDPSRFESAPAIFELAHAATFVTAFGLTLVNAAIHAFYLKRILDRSRLWMLWMMHALCGVFIVLGFGYMLSKVFGGATGFEWEVNLELMIVGSVLPLYEVTEMRALWRYQTTGRLRWIEHHRMSVTWLTSLCAAAVLLFVAHDATFLFAHPGLGLWERVAVQLGPQLAIHGPSLMKIVAYQRDLWMDSSSHDDASMVGTPG
jgi:hypothetical protein